MKKALLYLLPIIAVVWATIWPILYLSDSNKNYTIAVVQVETVLEGYEGMSDIAEKINEKRNNAESILRGLERQIDSLSKLEAQNSKEFNDLVKRYRDVNSQSKQELEQLESNLIAGAYNQINTLVKEYAKINELNIIYGSTSAGTIMYCDDYLDITKDVIHFINARR